MKLEVRNHEVRSANELPGLPYKWLTFHFHLFSFCFHVFFFFSQMLQRLMELSVDRQMDQNSLYRSSLFRINTVSLLSIVSTTEQCAIHKLDSYLSNSQFYKGIPFSLEFL